MDKIVHGSGMIVRLVALIVAVTFFMEKPGTATAIAPLCRRSPAHSPSSHGTSAYRHDGLLLVDVGVFIRSAAGSLTALALGGIQLPPSPSFSPLVALSVGVAGSVN